MAVQDQSNIYMSLFFHMLDADILNSEGNNDRQIMCSCFSAETFIFLRLQTSVDSYHILMAELLAWAVADYFL